MAGEASPAPADGRSSVRTKRTAVRVAFTRNALYKGFGPDPYVRRATHRRLPEKKLSAGATFAAIRADAAAQWWYYR